MPTILRVKGYRFFFYINDHSPAHIYIEKGEGTAKFSLVPVGLIKSKRFNLRQMKLGKYANLFLRI